VKTQTGIQSTALKRGRVTSIDDIKTNRYALKATFFFISWGLGVLLGYAWLFRVISWFHIITTIVVFPIMKSS